MKAGRPSGSPVEDARLVRCAVFWRGRLTLLSEDRTPAARYRLWVQFEPLSLSFDTVSSTLFVGGSIDEMSADKLRDALNRCMGETTPTLTVDLTDVSFLTSVGIGVLAAAVHRGADLGCTVEAVAEAGSIPERVLAICGLPHTIKVDGSSGQAPSRLP